MLTSCIVDGKGITHVRVCTGVYAPTHLCVCVPLPLPGWKEEREPLEAAGRQVPPSPPVPGVREGEGEALSLQLLCMGRTLAGS